MNKTNKTNEKFKPYIEELSAMLNISGVEHTLSTIHDGYQIRPVQGDWDVVIHSFSYGSSVGMLEGMGGAFKTEYDDVTGYLTPAEAFALIVESTNPADMNEKLTLIKRNMEAKEKVIDEILEMLSANENPD